MVVVLFVFSCLSYLVGMAIYGGAKSAIHEILSVAFFINGTVALSGSVIASRLTNIFGKLEEMQEVKPGPVFIDEYPEELRAREKREAKRHPRPSSERRDPEF